MSVYKSNSSMLVQLESAVRATTDSEGTDRNVRKLHEAMKIVVGPLQQCELKWLAVNRNVLVKYKSVPSLVLY